MTLPTGSFLYKEGVIPPYFALHFLPLSDSLRRQAHEPLAERQMHKVHKMVNCAFFHASHSLMVRLDTKLFWCQIPSWKKKAILFTTVTMIAYQDQLNAGFSELREVHNIESAQCSWMNDLLVARWCIIVRTSTLRPKCDAKKSKLWLVDYMSVRWPLEWFLASQSQDHQSEGKTRYI